MDLFWSFLRAILPVIRDCPWKIVSTAPVGRLHISRWYTMLDVHTDRSMGICNQMLNNTKFSFSCTHKNGNVCKIGSDVAPENGKRWAYGFTMDHLSTKTTRVCRVLNVCYHYKNRQSSMPIISQKHAPKLLQGPFHYYHFHVGYRAVRYWPGNDKTVTMQRRM